MTHSAAPAAEIRRAFTTGAVLNLAGAEVAGAQLAGLLVATPRSADGNIPALRLAGAVVRGPVQLPGATVTALVELTDCTFDSPIDLYAAELAGWRLTRCTLPGMQAANVRVHSELALQDCTVNGQIVLPDARIEGPLRLIGTSVHNPGDHALVGVRLAVRGVLDARRLCVAGEVRLSGARVDGNIDLRGAQLSRPGGDALEASGVQVGGNLRCDRGLSSQGRLVLAGASVAGNAVFSGAALQGMINTEDPAVLVLPRGSADPNAALMADRLKVSGNLVLDAGFTAVGTVRLMNARVGGYLWLSGATLGSPVKPDADEGDQPRPVPVALAADGIEVLGDLEARRSLPRTDQSTEAGAARAWSDQVGVRAGTRQCEPYRCAPVRTRFGCTVRRSPPGRRVAVPVLRGSLRLDPAAPRSYRFHPGLHRCPTHRTAAPARRLDQVLAGCPGRHDRQGPLRQPRVPGYRGRADLAGGSVEIGELLPRPAGDVLPFL